MIRKIVNINPEKCNGCGACVNACHEGAIALVNGKAKLIRDDFCDGLGDCLPACPMDAITIEEREADDYDKNAVEARMKILAEAKAAGFVPPAGGCPGTRMREFNRIQQEQEKETTGTSATSVSQLRQWPVQIKLVPVKAPFYQGAKLLVAADCTAYSYANFHQDFMRGHVTVIGCPKLDEGDYTEKLTAILQENEIKSLTIARMEVPCCGGLERAASTALKNSGKFIPWHVVTFSLDGHILND